MDYIISDTWLDLLDLRAQDYVSLRTLSCCPSPGLSSKGLVFCSLEGQACVLRDLVSPSGWWSPWLSWSGEVILVCLLR